MAWASSSWRQAPRVMTYAEACKFEKETTPIRGNGTNGGYKPMSFSRQYGRHFHIKRKGKTIIVKLGGIDLITYRKNKPVEVHIPIYSDVVTQDILYSVLGLRLTTFNNRVWGNCAFDGGEDANMGWVLMPNPRRGQRVRIAEFTLQERDDKISDYYEARWKIDKPTFPTIRNIDRTAMNALRKKYKPFIDYYKGVIKMHADTKLPIPIRRLPFRHTKAQFLKFLRSKDADIWYGLAFNLAAVTGYRHSPNYTASMKNLTDALLRFHKKEVFIAKEIRNGKMVKDNYYHLFK